MDVPTYCGSARNGGAGKYWSVYPPPPEQGFTIHCNSYYHRLVYGGGGEGGNATLVEMLGASSSIYTRYKSRECSSVDGGGYRDWGIGGIEIVGYGRTEGGRIKLLEEL